MSRYLFLLRKRELSMICLLVFCSFFVRPEQTIANLSLSGPAKNPFNLLGGIPPDQLFLGMYTMHTNPTSLAERNAANNLLGVQIEGVFAGTLINSYDKRSWAFGISREFYRVRWSDYWSFASGYRVGLITGYEGRKTIYGTRSDIAPLVDLHAQFSYLDHFGFEIMLTSSISLLFFFQF